LSVDPAGGRSVFLGVQKGSGWQVGAEWARSGGRGDRRRMSL